MKCFISYTTNREISFLHIKETITKNYKMAKALQSRFGIEKEDLISDCWADVWSDSDSERIDYILHKLAYSNILVSSYMQERQVRKTTSVMVYYFLKKIYDSEKKKELVRLDYGLTMKETIKNMQDNSIPSSPDNVRFSYVEKTISALSDAGLRPEHMVLLNWQIGIIDEDEAMEMLGVSRKTLFNRWNKIKPEIIKAYYKPTPRKSNNNISEEFK
jgi:hypothetical protein